MSADLLAEFDSFYQAPQDANQKATSFSNDLSSLGNAGRPQVTKDGGGIQWQAPVSTTNDLWGDMTSFQSGKAAQTTSSQDDIWGDFEGAEETKEPVQAPAVPASTSSGVNAAFGEQHRPKMARRDTIEMFSNPSTWSHTSSPLSSTYAGKPVPKNPEPTRKSSSGGDILFDADELSEEEDDFGDFETGVSSDPPPQQPPPPSLERMFGATSIKSKPHKRPVDLLPTSPNLSEHGHLPYPQAPKSPSFQERNPFAELGISTMKVSQMNPRSETASPVTAWPTYEPKSAKAAPYEDSPAIKDDLDENWGDFADLPADPATKPTINSKPTSGIEADAWEWDRADRVVPLASSKPKSTTPPTNIPPTNIPPPSILLPLFPPLFTLPQTTLFTPTTNQPFPLKNRILSSPTTITFLRSYLLIATTAAHIISGRKLRWKRDTLLSQSMKIGAAAATGGKSGMKLTGIDKSELLREEREVADVIRAWKDQLGRLKSVVAVANSSLADQETHLFIPDLAENMHVKIQEGAMTAPKQCVLCGLRREERVARVDVGIEDSFGEWWCEFWGHVACRNFWERNEGELRR